MNDTALRSVPAADEQDVTYYGLPSVKPSLWGGLVSSYMFVAGVGGSAQIIATAADLVGDRALAPLIRNEIWASLKRLKAEGQAILLVDKHIDALLKLADRHVVIEKGYVVWSGSSADLVGDPSVRQRHLQV